MINITDQYKESISGLDKFNQEIKAELSPILQSLGIIATNEVVHLLSDIFQGALKYLDRIYARKSSRQVYAISQNVVNNFYKHLDNHGGDPFGYIHSLQHALEKEFGIEIPNPFLVLCDPRKIYTLYLKPIAVKRWLAHRLFCFYYEVIQQYPKIKQSRSLDTKATYFDDLFNACENLLVKFCLQTLKGIRYNLKRNESTTIEFLMKELKAFTSERIMISVQYLQQKSAREINRLQYAIDHLEEENAKDHATNAAITIYSFIEWQQRLGNHSFKSMFDLCGNTTIIELQMLHHIATYSKHAESTRLKAQANTMATSDAYVEQLVTESGDVICAENGEDICSERSFLKISFGNLDAVYVLDACYKAALRGSYK